MNEKKALTELPASLRSKKDMVSLAKGMRSFITAGDYDIAISSILPPLEGAISKKDVAVIAASETKFPTGSTIIEFITTTATGEVISKEEAMKRVLEQPTYLISSADGNYYDYELITEENIDEMLSDEQFAFIG